MIYNMRMSDLYDECAPHDVPLLALHDGEVSRLAGQAELLALQSVV